MGYLYLLQCRVQERFWSEVEARKAKRRLTASRYSADQVTVHCRTCKRLLCWATDVRRHGTNYICVDDEFISSVLVVPLDNQQDFKTETHLGTLI